jgi:D-serine deaminase-like pyridoxal phosphate-dependent protein
LQLAQRVADEPALRLDGIFFYPGHVWLPAVEQPAELMRIDVLLAETIDLWKRSGLEAPIVSGGSTPTAYQSHHIPSMTEMRPGTYLYNDMNTVRAGFCALDDCAAAIVCTVVSTAVPGKVVIDAGTKTLTSDRNVKFPDSGHGHVVQYPDAAVVRLSEEHGEVDVSRCPRVPKLGERVTVIPNHICPCVNLQDAVWLRGSGGELSEMSVDARGMLV